MKERSGSAVAPARSAALRRAPASARPCGSRRASPPTGEAARSLRSPWSSFSPPLTGSASPQRFGVELRDLGLRRRLARPRGLSAPRARARGLLRPLLGGVELVDDGLEVVRERGELVRRDGDALGARRD